MFLLVMRDLDNADDVEEDSSEESVPLLSLLSLPEDLFTARWLISFRYSLYTLFLLYNRLLKIYNKRESKSIPGPIPV